MSSAISSLIGGGIGMVGSGITGKISSEAIAMGGEIKQKAFIYNAAVDDANADFLKAATGRETKRMREEGKELVGAQTAQIGASGITAESFGLLTAKGVENLEQDMQDFQLEREVQEFSLRSSARLKRLQGYAAKVGADVESELTKVGAAFSIMGQGSSAAGGAMGGK